jgi:hypothetical protein
MFNMRIPGLAACVVGVASLIAAAVLGGGRWVAQQGRVRVEGHVIAYAGYQGCHVLPVVEFLSNGQVQHVKGTVCFSFNGGPVYRLGDSIGVSYPPGKPELAEIDFWLENWFGTAFAAFFGLGFGGIGLVFARDRPTASATN